jgi:hypothetical protein
MILVAVQYYSITELWGSPAYTPEELMGRSPDVRRAADIVLARALGPRLRPAGGKPDADRRPPTVAAIDPGRATARDNCVALRPVGSRLRADVLLPRAGVWIRGAGGADSLALHRFGPLAAYPLAPISGGRAASLVIPPDSALAPWRLRVRAHGPLAVCTR